MKTVKMAVLAATMVVGATAAKAQDVVIRYTEWLPATYFLNEQVLYPYFEEIETVTEGRVAVEVSAGPLGPPPRNYQMVLDGIADMAWGVHGFTPGTFPLSELVELPFHSTTAEQNSVAYWKVFKEYLEPANMHPGVVTLALNTQPAGQIFNNKRELTSAEDLSDLKIRTTNSSISEVLTRLGATPVGIPVTEMREALEKGIVDGVSLTDEALYNFRIDEFIKHEMAVPGGFYNASMFVVINPAKWASISEADRDAIMAISGETLSRKFGAVWQAEQDGAVAKVLEDGIVISEPAGDFKAFIDDKLAGLDEAWIAKANDKGVDGAAALAAYRALSAE